MKCFLVVLCCAVAAHSHAMTEEDKAKFAEVSGECAKSEGIDGALLEKAYKGETPFPEKDALKCFSKCLYTKLGVLSEDGQINVDELKAKFGDDHKDLVDKCTQISTAEDACEKAYESHKCFLENHPKDEK